MKRRVICGGEATAVVDVEFRDGEAAFATKIGLPQSAIATWKTGQWAAADDESLEASLVHPEETRHCLKIKQPDPPLQKQWGVYGGV